jgi:hypothetical protein
LEPEPHQNLHPEPNPEPHKKNAAPQHWFKQFTLIFMMGKLSDNYLKLKIPSLYMLKYAFLVNVLSFVSIISLVKHAGP